MPASELEPELMLALAYAPSRSRAALSVLWRLDARLSAVMGRASGPMIRAIRLAWWRDALTALEGGPPPAEPLLIEVSASLLPAGIAAADLASLAEGWVALTQGEGEEEMERHAALRGGGLFALSSHLLIGRVLPGIAAAGERWALADRMASYGALAIERAALRAALRYWPRGLRALGVLSVLAARDLRRGADAPEPRGSPARVARALWMGISGR